MLLFTKRAASASAVCLLALAALTGAAGAQGRRAECSDYAAEAVDQYERNVRLRCGFEGARWSDERDTHFAWCLVTPRGAREESGIRHSMLEECAARRRAAVGDGKHASCDTYAKLAAVQAEAAGKYNCDFRGPEWRLDRHVHYRWCMSSKREYLIDQVRDRAAELQKCFNSLGDDDDGDGGRDDRRRF